MWSHDRGATEQLDRFWDDVAAGRSGDDDGLDPALAGAIRRLHARDDAPAPDPAFLARLGRQLELEAERRAHLAPVPEHNVPAAQARGLPVTPGNDVPRVRYGQPRGGWRRWVREGGAMVAAAAVLLVFGGLLAALLSGRDGSGSGLGSGTTTQPSATAGGFTITIVQGTLTGNSLRLTFRVAAASDTSTPDLHSLGEFSGFIPSLDMEMKGLAFDSASGGAIHPNPNPITSPPYVGTAHFVTVPFTLTQPSGDPVSLTIKTLRFSPESGGPREYPGPWTFTLVPSDYYQETTTFVVNQKVEADGVTFAVDTVLETDNTLTVKYRVESGAYQQLQVMEVLAWWPGAGYIWPARTIRSDDGYTAVFDRPSPSAPTAGPVTLVLASVVATVAEPVEFSFSVDGTAVAAAEPMEPVPVNAPIMVAGEHLTVAAIQRRGESESFTVLVDNGEPDHAGRVLPGSMLPGNLLDSSGSLTDDRGHTYPLLGAAWGLGKYDPNDPSKMYARQMELTFSGTLATDATHATVRIDHYSRLLTGPWRIEVPLDPNPR